jgi:hypothetical protein
MSPLFAAKWKIASDLTRALLHNNAQEAG